MPHARRMPHRPAASLTFTAERPLPLTGLDRAETVSIGRGALVLEEEWDRLFIGSRLRTRIEVVARRLATDRDAFAGAAALALHGLPVFGLDDRIDLIVGGSCTRHNAGDVRRHHSPLPDDDVSVLDGVRATNIERTVYDVIRLGSLEAAVVAFDAALRRVAWNEDDNTYDESAAEHFRDRIRMRISAHTGARGIRQARFVVEFADGRAQLPGESLLRLRIWQASLPAPSLQHRVELGGGRYALLDLAFPERRRWLEFDGGIKYTDATMLAGRTSDEVRLAQAGRQAAAERATGWRCDRVQWAHVVSSSAFAALAEAIAFHR